MANILDYIEWRGDIPFCIMPRNEVDNIIFARISYFPLKRIDFKNNDKITDTMVKLFEIPRKYFFSSKDYDLVRALAKSNRFKDLHITEYDEESDMAAEKQFAAITIPIPSLKEIYISYRGTDSSIIGLKEDFNLTFQTNIPSQLRGVEYFNKVAKKYKKESIVVGGHSKGGNIAVYSSIFCDDEYKDRIKEIINADGPGFDETITKNEKYINIIPKVKTYIPQSSIVGRLLEHSEDYTVVEAVQRGIMQHNIYTWQLMNCSLSKISEVTKESHIINEIVRDWLNKTTPSQRENFINMLYDLLVTIDVTDIQQIVPALIKNFKKIRKLYKNISPEDKAELDIIFKSLFDSVKEILKEEIKFKKNKKLATN